MLFTMSYNDLQTFRYFESKNKYFYDLMNFFNTIRIKHGDLILAQIDQKEYNTYAWHDMADPVYKNIHIMSIIPIHTSSDVKKAIKQSLNMSGYTLDQIEKDNLTIRFIDGGDIRLTLQYNRYLQQIYNEKNNPTRFNISKEILYRMV